MAGKTGTTNESTDVWFVGFTPDITAGVWVGYDEKKSLGEKIYGSNLALPIWIEFMDSALERFPKREFDNVYRPTPLEITRAERKATHQMVDRPIQVEEIPPALSSLWQIKEMTSVVVVRLEDTNASVMEYLDSMGILPDTEIYVLEKGPLNATILISLDGVEHSLSESLARQIFVKIE